MNKIEDKGSYEYNWNAGIKETWETINATKVKLQRDFVNNSMWQYKFEMDQHYDWTKKLLGISELESGYEFVLPKNTVTANKQLSMVISSSWLDDRTNEIILNGIFLIPQYRIIITFHTLFTRFCALDKNIFIIKGKVSTWSTWIFRAILLIFCVKWIFNSVQSHAGKISLIYSLLIILMLTVEFMQEVAVEKAFSNLRIDGNQNLYQAVLYEKLLKIIQVTGTFLMAIRIAQQLVFITEIQRITYCLKLMANTFMSIHFLQLLMALILSHTVYISQYDVEQDFTNVLSALMVLIITPGRNGHKFIITECSERTCFFANVVLVFVKFIFTALLLSELDYQVRIKSGKIKIKERMELMAKNENLIHNEISMNFADTHVSRNKAKQGQSKKKGSKIKSEEKIISNTFDHGCQLELPFNRAKTNNECLNSKISEITVCINESYLETIAWDVFLLNLSIRLGKSTSVQDNTGKPFENRRKKDIALKGAKGKINSKGWRFDRKEGVAGKLLLPEIKVRKGISEPSWNTAITLEKIEKGGRD